MRKLLAIAVLLFSGLLAAQPVLAANPTCNGCCDDMAGKAMMQCQSAGCQACANAPCLQGATPRLTLLPALDARPASNSHLAPSPATIIWTPPD